MPLRIGFDLDGVLADMESALIRQAEQLFGLHVPPVADAKSSSMLDLVPEGAADNAPLQHELHLTDHQRRVLWRGVRNTLNFWESLEEIEPGCVRRLASLATERAWEIIFLTKRPSTAGATAQMQSQRWLEANGFRLPSVYVVTGSRGLIASALALDIVVDDTPENCIDVAADSQARTIAIFRMRDAMPPPVLTRMGIHVARSTAECLDLLVDIDTTLAKPQPGRLERVMRTLGLKQPIPV